jgi:hypothetical protein
MHFAICALMACCLKFIVGAILAAAIVCFIGMTKEFYDKKRGEGFAKKDVLCNFVGINSRCVYKVIYI